MSVIRKLITKILLLISGNRTYTKSLHGGIRPTGKLIAHKLPKDLNIHVNDGISIGEGYGIHQTGDEREAIRISDSEGQTVAADQSVEGSIDFSIKGNSRQGEDGTVEVCRILISHLNKEGANWCDPSDLTNDNHRKEEGIDCEAYDGDYVLKVQVTRVAHNIWKELSIHRIVSRSLSLEDSTEDIWCSILKKTKKIPEDQRKELVLALDATETPSYSFALVIKSFQNNYGSKTKELGYKSVWIVGPSESLTFQLDVSSSV